MKNKFKVTLGNGFPQISESFIVLFSGTLEDLEWDQEFLRRADEVLWEMANDFCDDGEDPEDLREELGIDSIEPWEDSFDSYHLFILYEE